MREVWEFPLLNPSTDLVCEVHMPKGAEVVSATLHNGDIAISAIVTPLNPREARRFTVYRTGNGLARSSRFIGTYLDNLSLAHVFELVGEPLPEGLNLPEDAEDAYRTLTAAGFQARADTDLGSGRIFGRCWVAPDDEPLTTELIMAVATLQEHGFGPVVSK